MRQVKNPPVRVQTKRVQVHARRAFLEEEAFDVACGVAMVVGHRLLRIQAQEIRQRHVVGRGPAPAVVVQRHVHRPFGFLRQVDSQNLLTYIIDEHPQTIALIMSHLPPNYSAEILAGLPEARRMAVVRRIATMGRTNPEIIREVEKGLERRMSSVMSQSFENAGGVGAVAEMLNVTDRATERTLLEGLTTEDPELVEEIRRLMFVFEDIGRFGDKDVQIVLKNVETSQWALALKGASDVLKEKVLKNMSERAAETLREEMEYLGPAKRSVVEAKQQEIVDVIRALEDRGEIDLNAINEQEEMVQ